MAEWFDLGIETDPDELAQRVYDYIQERLPDWEPPDASYEAWQTEAMASMAAELRDVAAQVPPTAMQVVASKIFNFPVLDDEPAIALSQWVFGDSAGYTVPADTLVAVPRGADSVVFRVLEDFTVASGSNTVSGVELEAVATGEAANGLTGPAEVASPLPGFPDLTVTLTTTSDGGQTGDTPDQFLDKFVTRMRAYSARPTLPEHFSMLALDVAGVARATTLDNYNADTSSTGIARCCTVAVQAASGAAPDSTVMTAVRDYLASMRETTFLTFVIGPSQQSIDVTVDVAPTKGVSEADAQTAAEESINAFFASINWGARGNTGDLPDWTNTTTVRFLDVANAILNTTGVNKINSLQIGKHGGTMGTADLDISTAGPAPVTTPGTVTVTVTP